MRITLFLPAVFLFALVACNTNKHEKNDATPETPVVPLESKSYENGNLSFSYPNEWDVYEVENNMSDSFPALKQGYSLLISSPENMEGGTPAVYIVKSAMFDVYDTPEEWRDASILFKPFEERYYEVEYTCDSLDIAGEPAALVIYKTVSEEHPDTVIQIQYVVLRENKELYYVNNQFAMNDTVSPQIGFEIIRSLTFK